MLSATVLSGTSATSLNVVGWVSLMGTTAIATSVSTALISSPFTAPAAQAATVSSWQFDPASNQLDLVLPDGVTPRYFLVAEPARIVVDLANTDFGSNATQRTYPGAIAEIQVGQFQPGITRIVLRLAPGTILAPGQVDLQQVSSGAGVTRWVLRPLLADTTGSNMATQPTPQPTQPAPNTATAPAAPATASSPPALPTATATSPTSATERAPAESTAQSDESQREARVRARAERRAQEQARREQEQQQRQARREQERVQAEQARQARQQRSQPGADSFPSPNLAQAPTAPAPAPSPQAPALPPATFANPQLPTVVVPGSGDFRATRPAAPAATGSGSLPTTPLSPPTNDVALTPPANNSVNNSVNNPVVFQSTTTSATTRSTVGQQPTLLAAAQIIDFGQPLPLPGRPQPPSNGGGGLIGVGDVLVPAGTRLNLRYEGQDPLDIFPSDSFEAVLSLDEEVRDRSGFTVFPRGSSVIGRFVSNDAGEAQFVAQTISFSGRSFTFRAESETIAGERQVDRQNLLRNSAIGAVAGIGLSAITGVGILPAILGGAAAGAAGTYSNSPAEPPVIQPNQVIEVRTIDDVLR